MEPDAACIGRLHLSLENQMYMSLCRPCQQETAPAVAKSAPRAEGIDVELDAARIGWLDERTAMIGAKSGQLLAATLAAEGGSVRRIQVMAKCCGFRKFLQHTLLQLRCVLEHVAKSQRTVQRSRCHVGAH